MTLNGKVILHMIVRHLHSTKEIICSSVVLIQNVVILISSCSENRNIR